VLHNRGQQDAALIEFRSVVDAAVRLHGPVHLKTAEYHFALGRRLEERGEFAEAARLLQDALTIHRQLLGPTHPDVTEAQLSLAQVLEKLDRWDEAECLLLEVGVTPQSESAGDAP
jgi:serine/threonine-protein kinase